MEKLTHQEEEAMQAVWKTGEGSVKQFLENMPPPGTPYTTLSSTIKINHRALFLPASAHRTDATCRLLQGTGRALIVLGHCRVAEAPQKIGEETIACRMFSRAVRA